MAENMIELRELVKTFNTANGSVTALENINLTIEKGEIFGIIGLSGAGKSTLVRCINYLEVPTSGSVIFQGKNLGTLKEQELREARREMSMIFQQFNLLAQRNVLRNVTFPLELSGTPKAEARERAMELLKMVGLEDRAKAYPAQLSGGQKQRVAIARALATRPKVLLCDEATSALDPNTTKQILELLKRINQELGVTVIVITHEMSVIEAICGRVAIIDQSHIAEEGPVAKIFSEPKTRIGKQLILGDAGKNVEFGERKVRLVFDGNVSQEPVISNLVMTCKTPVNIVFANIKEINGKSFGQMVLELPADETERSRALHFLAANKIPYEEVR